ncbi:MAG: putative transport system permease protein [Acidobacteriota bacterium]|jgi:putative ABC transport system permease protein|nr:putative transport system permease protein [Acidobacteriota bacterium]
MAGRLLRRLRALLRRGKLDRELDEELRYHLEREAELNVRDGMTPEEARRAALRAFGGVEQARELCREVRGVRMLQDLWQDLRYGARKLRKSPGFTLVAVMTLALGVGANTAVFSVVNAVLLRPLPFPDSERIVALDGVNPSKGITDSNMSIPDFADWKEQSQSFEQVAGFVTGGALLVSGEEAERVRGTSVTEDFFPLYRTPARLGRVLESGDAKKDVTSVAVLSHGLWQRRYGGDPNVVGRQIIVGRESMTVVGVMPPGFNYPERTEMWFPLVLDPAAERRDNRYLEVFARLKPEATLARAQAELDAVNARLAQSYVETNSGWGVRLTNLRERLVGNMRTPLLVILGAVALVLLIACGNVANLLLARATARRREFAVRDALGASRGRIVRQLLTESCLLSLAGGVAGVLISLWLTQLLVGLIPSDTPRLDEVRPDARIFGFALAVSVFSGLLFGLAPALQASRRDLGETLKEGGRTGVGGRRSNRSQSILIVSEIALSFMLLAGAGLLVRSFMRLRDVNPGFNPAGVLTLRSSASGSQYPAGPARAELYRQVIERLGSLPGVEAAGAVLSLPLGGDTYNVGRSFIREGRPATPEESANASYLVATPGYFGALRIPLVSGRTFMAQDSEKAPMVVVINETMARRYWPGESPLGKRITIWRDEKFPREIVGVVGDTRSNPAEPAGAQMYVPFAQDPNWASLSLVVRTSADPASLAAAARNEVHALDKAIPVYNARPMSNVVAASLAERRASTLLVGAFALLALLLALVGIYGVTAYYVTQRTHEIGLRMALGARARHILGLVVGRSLRLTLAGLAVGLCGALALTRVMESLLYEVKPADPVTLAAAAALLGAISLLACLLPARRAARVDPLIALRAE